MYDPNQPISVTNNPEGISGNVATTPTGVQVDTTTGKVITPASLQPATPINVVQPNPTSPTPAAGGPDLSTELNPTLQEKKISDTEQQLIDLNNQLTGQTDFAAQQRNQQGLPDLQKTQDDLNAKLQLLQANEANIPLQLKLDSQGRGRTLGGVSPLETAKLFENSVSANIVKAQLAGIQGKITTANAFVNQAVKDKFGPLEEKQKALTANLELIKNDPQTSLQEKNRAAKQLEAQKAKDAQIARDKQNFEDTQKLILEYPQAGPQARAEMEKAKTPVEVQAIAKKYNLKTLAEQQAEANIGKTNSTTNLNNSKVTTVGGNGVVAGTKVPAEISGDVEDVLSGRNTLYNIRQTMGKTNAAAAFMQKMRDAIHLIDPNFDFVASDAGGKAVSSAYYQKSIAAIDSVLPNIDKVVQLSNDVSRIGIKGIDALIQKGGLQLNNQKIANFHEAQKLLSDEIGLALGQGTVSDMKLQLGFDVTDPSVSPEVFASNMALIKQFVENRKQGLQGLRYSSSTNNQIIPEAKSPAEASSQPIGKPFTYNGHTVIQSAPGVFDIQK